jgi:hypothetical protein
MRLLRSRKAVMLCVKDNDPTDVDAARQSIGPPS